MTELVFILDRSGSMSGLERDTIGGFNSMIEKQKKEEGEAVVKITLPNRNASANTAETPAGAPQSNEKLILDFITSNGYIVRSDVDQLLDVSQATANRILKRMVAEGLIYQDGNGRKTKYRRK